MKTRQQKKPLRNPTQKVRTAISVLEEGTNSSPIIDHGANVSEPQQTFKGLCRTPKNRNRKFKT